jgi:hypothetical protein
MTGAGAAAQRSGDSAPWNCTAVRLSRATASLTTCSGASTNTPTRATNGGTAAQIASASASVTCRSESLRITPSASAPARTAAAASTGVVIPHTLTRVLTLRTPLPFLVFSATRAALRAFAHAAGGEIVVRQLLMVVRLVGGQVEVPWPERQNRIVRSSPASRAASASSIAPRIAWLLSGAGRIPSARAN